MSFKKIAALVVIAVCSIIILEIVLQTFATYMAGKGRLFETDPVVGWRVRANLDLTRRNPEGEKWTVTTGKCGLRGPCQWPPTGDQRLLVLGDSMVFGEGVSLDDRFDSRIAEAMPGWSIVNLGVMGYGTDQQILVARGFVAQLEPGDIVLLVVNGNDFYDILRRRFAGRPKPWFEAAGPIVIEYPPTFFWFDYLRDYSYIAAVVGKRTERRRESYSTEEIERSIALFQQMVSNEIDLWSQKGLQVVLAHYETDLVTRERPATVQKRLESVWDALCVPGRCHCTNLDPVVSATSGRQLLQGDGHWNAEGHRAVAAHLQQILATMRRGERDAAAGAGLRRIP